LYGNKAGPIVRQREEYMLSMLVGGLVETVAEHPKLRERENVRALVTLGGNHTHVYHRLKHQHPKPAKARREFGRRPVIYSPHVSCLGAGQFGVEVTQDMTAKAYAELIAQAIVRAESVKVDANHEAEKDLLMVKAIGGLSLGEIESLHHSFRRTLETGNGYDTQRSVVGAIINDLEAK
jgi:hypothetical protein